MVEIQCLFFRLERLVGQYKVVAKVKELAE